MDRLVRVVVTLKDVVLDPQGDATLHALNMLGFDNIENVRVGKVFHLTFKENLEIKLLMEQASLMAQRLLCNDVMETFQIQIVDEQRGS